jgi:hypothetical protein
LLEPELMAAPARGILYLLDLAEERLVSVHEDSGDGITAELRATAQAAADASGHAHVLSRGLLFFQPGRGTRAAAAVE